MVFWGQTKTIEHFIGHQVYHNHYFNHSLVKIHCQITEACKHSKCMMNEQTKIELEAATFRRLLKHLQEHTDVQNIDLMILADFCRNCLAKWYSAEAKLRGLEVDYASAQETIYGMPYAEWKQQHQTEATPEQIAAMEVVLRRQQESGH